MQMESNSIPQPDDSESHRSAGGSDLAFKEIMLEALLSDDFQEQFEQRFNELPEGDYGRARVLLDLGGQFSVLHRAYQSSTALDHAIRYTERALQEIPKPHPELKKAVVVHIDLLQKKAEQSRRPEDGDRYISGLQLGIKLLEECTLKEEKKRELGCAYFSRFGQTEDNKDLDSAIETLEGCFKSSEKACPQATVCLGAALGYRFKRDKDFKDLDRSVELLRIGIEAIPRDDAVYAPLRDFGLNSLAPICTMVEGEQCGRELRGRVINNLEKILPFTPPDSETVGRVKKHHLNLMMAQCFRQPESTADLLAALDVGSHDRVGEDSLSIVPAGVPANVTQTYKYQPLSDDRKHIRLIKLLPGERGDFIRCEILAVRLDAVPPYEALSYVWGDPKQTVKICVRDRVLEVTKNLYSALLRLRQTKTERTLWIDAIAINQADLNEKRHQITMMRDIYKGASTVIMWLGEPKVEEMPLKSGSPKEPAKQSPGLKSPLPGLSVKSHSEIASPAEGNASPGSKQGAVTVSEAKVPARKLVSKLSTRYRHNLKENLQWMQPVFYGSKPATIIPENDIPGFEKIAQAAGNHINLQQEVEEQFYDVLFKRLPGAGIHVFDWTSPSNIPAFFTSPQTKTLWPVLGAFTIIHCFSQLKHFPQLPFFEGYDADLSYHNSQAWVKSAQELRGILTSQYWERAWILQEVVLARTPVVYYGSHVMAFNELVRAGQAFELHYTMCCSKWGEKAYRNDHTYWTELHHGFSKFNSLDRLRRAYGAPPILLSGPAAPSNSNQSSTTSNPPLAALSLSGVMRSGIAKRQATDARDLIYGVLGLVQGDIHIEADYTLSVAEVFARATAHIIQEDKDLGVLALNDLGRRSKHKLPSWVPDWTSRGMFCPQPYEMSLYSADKARPCHFRLVDGVSLEVRSVKVDTIKEVGEMRTVSWSHTSRLVELFREWRRLAGLGSTNSNQDGENGQEQQHDDNRDEQFWRTVFADVITDHDMENNKDGKFNRQNPDSKERRFKPHDIAKIRAWWEWLQQEAQSGFVGGAEWHSLRSRPHPYGYHVVTDRFWGATETRKMIFTEQHRMGTGPSEFGSMSEFANAEAGDEVHVLFGLSAPVILRRIDEPQQPKTAGGPRYRFLGICYLHGIMDGEALMGGGVAMEDIVLC